MATCRLTPPRPLKNTIHRDVVLLALDLAEGGELFDFMMYTGAFSEQVRAGFSLGGVGFDVNVC
jgi:hypothetical protein